jgi:hypothetical protein
MHIYRFCLFCFLFFFNNQTTLAQKDVKSDGEYQMRIEKNMTQQFAEEKCIELARLEAIRKAFGDVIIQGNSTFIQNKSGEKVESQNVFNFFSDTYVNGEWIKDLNKPSIEFLNQDNERWIKVKVTCIVRPLRPSIVNFTNSTASCPDIKCSTEQFNDGQDFFVHFKSPIKGYLAIYLDDPNDKTTYRILPYKKYKSLSAIEIEADKEYVFFSKKHDYFSDPQGIDELVMTLTDKNTAEINKLFILFSPTIPLDKPILFTAAQSQAQLENTKDDYDVPSYLSSEKFQEWLQQTRSRNKEMEFKSFIVNIRPIR